MRILSFNVTHDSSVSVLNDGHLEFFCKEERISRVKRDKNPFKSLELYSKLNLGPIDHIVYSSPSDNQTDIRGFFHTYTRKKFDKDESYLTYSHHISHAMCKITTNNPYSIVKVYEGATTLIGQHPLENGKTMGLSSYGENLDYEPLFYDSVPLAHKFTTMQTGEVCFFGEESLITKDVNPDNYQHYANRAKQVQLTTQYEALKLIAEYVEKTGIKNVCLVGGYALNVVANNYYLKNLPDVAFYFEPVADDTGISLGAAMLAHHQVTGEYAAPLKDNFYHYYDHSEHLEGGKKANITKLVSMLIEGKSVAIFEGNPEAGPRALGHRSILFDARNPNAKEIVNRIKRREWYRPFAGVILEGIIHVDGTCRIQTVNEGFLFDLITAFYKKTKCPMVLNTSFNLAGEPLVQTKAEAIETLQNSELDAIYFVEEGRILTK